MTLNKRPLWHIPILLLTVLCTINRWPTSYKWCFLAHGNNKGSIGKSANICLVQLSSWIKLLLSYGNDSTQQIIESLYKQPFQVSISLYSVPASIILVSTQAFFHHKFSHQFHITWHTKSMLSTSKIL